MHRKILSLALLCGAFAVSGCSPAEVQPPPETIPNIPPPRGADAGAAPAGGGAAVPAGRTPAVPK